MVAPKYNYTIIKSNKSNSNNIDDQDDHDDNNLVAFKCSKKL